MVVRVFSVKIQVRSALLGIRVPPLHQRIIPLALKATARLSHPNRSFLAIATIPLETTTPRWPAITQAQWHLFIAAHRDTATLAVPQHPRVTEPPVAPELLPPHMAPKTVASVVVWKWR